MSPSSTPHSVHYQKSEQVQPEPSLKNDPPKPNNPLHRRARRVHHNHHHHNHSSNPIPNKPPNPQSQLQIQNQIPPHPPNNLPNSRYPRRPPPRTRTAHPLLRNRHARRRHLARLRLLRLQPNRQHALPSHRHRRSHKKRLLVPQHRRLPVLFCPRRTSLGPTGEPSRRAETFLAPRFQYHPDDVLFLRCDYPVFLADNAGWRPVHGCYCAFGFQLRRTGRYVPVTEDYRDNDRHGNGCIH